MEPSEHDVVISHPVQRLTGEIIAEKGRVAFHECIDMLFLQQVVRDAFNLIRRAAVQRGDRCRIADVGRNGLNVFLREVPEFRNMIQQPLLRTAERFRVLCLHHGIDEGIDFVRLDSRQIVSDGNVELEAVLCTESVFLCQEMKRDPGIDVLVLGFRNRQLRRPFAVVAFVVHIDAGLGNVQFVEGLDGFQFDETCAAKPCPDDVLCHLGMWAGGYAQRSFEQLTETLTLNSRFGTGIKQIFIQSKILAIL